MDAPDTPIEHAPRRVPSMSSVARSSSHGTRVMVRDTGIGLPRGMAQRIVEPHGGRMWDESAGEGRRTTIWVRLPQTAAAEPGAVD
jgi:signal transduction histidine kinase